MTSTLKKKLKEHLDNEEYYGFISTLYENGLSVDEYGLIYQVGNTDDPGDDFLVNELMNLEATDILFSALNFVLTEISKIRDNTFTASNPVWKNSSINDSTTSIPSLDFVKF